MASRVIALPDKQFGVFDFAKAAAHPLTAGHGRTGTLSAFSMERSAGGCAERMRLPRADAIGRRRGRHIREEEKTKPASSISRAIRSTARDAAEGIPRDIKRFLKRERETYPSMPKGYFDGRPAKAGDGFPKTSADGSIASDQREELMEAFRTLRWSATLQRAHGAPAASTIYRNWSAVHVAVEKDGRLETSAVASVQENAPAKTQ